MAVQQYNDVQTERKQLYKLNVSAEKKKCKVSEIAARKNFIRLRTGPTVT